AEGEHGDAAALALGELDGLLHGALLVRADGEAGHPGVDVLAVGGHDDPAADLRAALDADSDLHVSGGSGRLRGRTAGPTRRRPRSPGSARPGTRPRARSPRRPAPAAGRPSAGAARRA